MTTGPISDRPLDQLLSSTQGLTPTHSLIKQKVDISEFHFEDDLVDEMHAPSLGVTISANPPDQLIVVTASRFSNQVDREVQFEDALTEANARESAETSRPQSPPPGYEVPSVSEPALLRPVTPPPEYNSQGGITSQDGGVPLPSYAGIQRPIPQNTSNAAVTPLVGSTQETSHEEFHEVYSYLRTHEEATHQKVLNLLFDSSRDEVYLSSDSATVENNTTKAILKIDRQFDSYQSLGFETKDQVKLFLERMRDRLVHVGTVRQTECNARKALIEDAIDEAIVKARNEGRDAQIQVTNNQVFIDGKKVPVDGPTEYKGVEYSELKAIAREYIDDLISGKIYDYKSVYLAPTREDVESGRRTGMEIIRFTEHEERRKLFINEGWGAFTTTKNEKIEDEQENSLKNRDLLHKDTLENQIESHANGNLNQGQLDEKLYEQLQKRKLESIEVLQSELEDVEKRREFIRKVIEELRNNSRSTTFIISSSPKDP